MEGSCSASGSAPTRADTHISTPILSFPTPTAQNPAVILSSQHDPGVSPPPFFPSYSLLIHLLLLVKLIQEHAHACIAHISISAQPCPINLFVCALNAAAFMHVCNHDYMNYVSGGRGCGNSQLQQVIGFFPPPPYQ